ncbi:hypothetical protein HDU81_004371 [Chytriomyces hyalinus]|nr:hypothetical protein HDU81_004371 [Chytriomyces hyalinus]
MIKGSLCVFLKWRVLEVAAMERSQTRGWTGREYMLFLVDSDYWALKHSVRKQGSAKFKQSPWQDKWIPWEKCDRVFYYTMMKEAVAHAVIFTLTTAYFETYGYQHDKWTVSLLDWRQVLPHVMLGFMLYTQLQLTYLWRLPFNHVLGIPYLPMHDAPYLSTSLRDFWAQRWNSRIQMRLRSLVFQPCISTLALAYPNHGATNTRIASLATFLASAVYHMYCVAVFMPRESMYSTAVFFVVQGLACVAESTLRRRIHGRFGWCFAMAVLVWSSPMFAGSFARSRVLHSLPPIPGLVELFKSVI